MYIKYLYISQILETFIRESNLEPFNPVNYSGYWGQVTARITRANHFMLSTAMSNELELKLKSLLRIFCCEAGRGIGAHVTSLYFQALDKK